MWEKEKPWKKKIVEKRKSHDLTRASCSRKHLCGLFFFVWCCIAADALQCGGAAYIDKRKKDKKPFHF